MRTVSKASFFIPQHNVSKDELPVQQNEGYEDEIRL